MTIKGIERTVEIPQQPSDGGSKKGKFDCPLSDCNKTYVYVSGWTKRMQNCNPHVKLISASEPTVSAPQLSRQSFASNQDTSTGDEVLTCPLALIGARLESQWSITVMWSTDIRESKQGQCPSHQIMLALSRCIQSISKIVQIVASWPPLLPRKGRTGSRWWLSFRLN